MPALLPIRFRTELARQFHRTITNTINVLTEDRNTITPLNVVMYEFTATAGQTIFTGVDDNGKTLSYTPGRIEVYVNGSKLNSEDYTSPTGSRVVLVTGATLNDVVSIVKMNVLTYPNPSDYYHIFLGKTTPWNNEFVPPTPQDTRATDSEIKRNILAVKKVQPNDTALLIPRINWTSDTVYESYLDNENYTNTNFYVMNTGFRIYKCLYSPGTPSLVEPTQTTTGPFVLSDGYYWQLMYEIPAAERIKFVTDDFIPVKFYATSTTFDHNGLIDEIIVTVGGSGYTTPPTVVVVGDGEGATATATLSGTEVSSVTITNSGSGYTFALVQFIGGGGTGAQAEVSLRSADLPITVNQDVASYAISSGGGVNFVKMINGGTGYLSSTTSVTIEGDGVGAEAVATVINGSIVSITVTERGKGYTFANVNITGVGASASARAVIEPQGGHGSDIPKELFATTVAICVNIEDMLNDFFLDNDFRQLGLIKNIKNFTESEIFSLATGNACYVIGVPDLSQYNVDDVILTNTGGEYIVVNKTSSTVYLLPVIDSIASSSILENQTTGTSSLNISSLTTPEVSTKTGDVVYIRNISPVTRETGQVEQVKLYFSF